MTSLRFKTLATLAILLLVTTTGQATNLRNGDKYQQPETQSDSGLASDSADDATQNSTTSGSSNAIETQSKVGDKSTSAPAAGETAGDGVKAWAQCGGLYYLGQTKCQPHTFCKQLSEFISVCFPESRPTEKVIRLEL